MRMTLSAFVVGFTGEVGKCLVSELAKHEATFGRVTLIGRRKVEYPDDARKRMEQTVVDFEKLEDYADVFKGFDVGFCCLGSTRAKAGSAEAFWHIDHGYIVRTARLAKQGGCKQFHLVSTYGANRNSYALYSKVKGVIEEDVTALNFDKLYIYRPKMLLCDREERRLAERFALFCMKPIVAISPTLLSVPTTTVAKALLVKAMSPMTPGPAEAVHSDVIHELGKTL